MTKLQRIYAASLRAADLFSEFRAVFGHAPGHYVRERILDEVTPDDATAFDRRRIAFLAVRMSDLSA